MKDCKTCGHDMLDHEFLWKWDYTGHPYPKLGCNRCSDGDGICTVYEELK